MYSGKELRQNGINRIGNLVVPNNNYGLFEDWIMPILDELLKEQKSTVIITKEISHKIGRSMDSIKNHSKVRQGNR